MERVPSDAAQLWLFYDVSQIQTRKSPATCTCNILKMLTSSKFLLKQLHFKHLSKIMSTLLVVDFAFSEILTNVQRSSVSRKLIMSNIDIFCKISNNFKSHTVFRTSSATKQFKEACKGVLQPQHIPGTPGCSFYSRPKQHLFPGLSVRYLNPAWCGYLNKTMDFTDLLNRKKEIRTEN